MRAIYPLVVIGALLALSLAPLPALAWKDTDYTHCANVTVMNLYMNVDNATLELYVPFNESMRDDMLDVNFTDTACTGEGDWLPSGFRSNTSGVGANVSVKFTAANGNVTLGMYFGKSTPSAHNLSHAYLYYDSMDTVTGWTASAGCTASTDTGIYNSSFKCDVAAEAGGEITCYKPWGISINVNHTQEYYLKHTESVGGYFTMGDTWKGINNYGSRYNGLIAFVSGAMNYMAWGAWANNTNDDNAWHNYKSWVDMSQATNAVELSYDGAPKVTRNRYEDTGGRVNATLFEIHAASEVGTMWIDEYKIAAYFPRGLEPQSSIGTAGVQAVGASISVTTNAPANATTVNNSANYAFTVYGTAARYNCTYELDASNTTLGSLANNTQYTTTFTGLSASTHRVKAYCWNTTDATSATSTRWFSFISYNVTSRTYSSNIYEVSLSTFNITVVAIPGVAVNASLLWNGTEYAAVLKNTTASTYNFGVELHAPLPATNNTLVSFNWTVVYNSTDYVDTTYDQRILFSYWVGMLTSSAGNVTEGDNFTAYLYRTNLSNLATMSASFQFNGSSYGGTAGAAYHYGTIAAPVGNGSKVMTGNLTVTYGGRSRTMGNQTVVDVHHILLDDCSAYTTHIAIFRLYDEKTLALVNGSMAITLEAYTAIPLRNYSFDLTANDTFHLCMDGDTLVFNVNATTQYSSLSAYVQRNYYLVDAQMSGTASLVNMYLLNTTYDDTVTYTVKDIDGNELGGRLLKILRYYPGSNTYRLVAMGLTNDDGTVALNLEKYFATYSYIVDFNGALVQTFDSEVVNADARTLTIGAALRNLFWKYYGKVSSVCVFENVTNYISCTVADSSNKVAGGTLAVYKRGATIWNNTCTESAADGAFTLTCLVGANVTGNTYYWELRASMYDDDSKAYTTALLDSGYIQQGMSAIYGTMGLLVVIFLVMAVTLLGAYNPAVAIILNVVVLSVSYMIGILAVSELALIGLIAIAAIIVFKLKT